MSEFLCRLNAKVQSFSDTGGKSDLTTSDIAAALAGANDTGLNVLLGRICNDRQAQTKAFYPIYRGVVDIAIEQKWKLKRGQDRLRSLAQLAVFESVNDQACPRCKGTTFNPRDPTKACAPCRGTGRYTINAGQRAEALGVSTSAWNKTWEPRYSDVKIFIQEQEYSALKNILRRLFRG